MLTALRGKRLMLFLASVFLLLVIIVPFGCTGSDKTGTGEVTPQEAEKHEGKKAGEETEILGITVNDDLGREVFIPGDVKRVLALNPNMMEALFNIGITPVAKVEEYDIKEEGISLSSVGSQTSVDIESVYEVEPELIIAHSRHHGDIVDSLEDTGATVYIYNPAELVKMEEGSPMIDSTVLVGKLLGREDEAREYVKQLHKRAGELKQEIQSVADIENAAIIQEDEGIRVAQNGSLYGSIINALGFNNIVPDDIPGTSTESFIPFDAETFLEKDPDLILIRAATNDPEQNKKAKDMFASNPMWKELSAVKNNRVITLPYKIRPGATTPERMLEITAEIIISNEE